jgi:hypothetical protein
MSQRKSFHPSGLSWRERELQKEKDRKEAEARAKEEERLKNIRPTEENFPSLGGSRVVEKPKPLTMTGMFAKLASDWKEHDDIQKMREEQRREQEKAEQHMFIRRVRIQRTSPIEERRYGYEEPEDEESHTPKYGHEDERWNVVEYKHRSPHKPRQINYNENDDQALEEDFEQNANILNYDN